MNKLEQRIKDHLTNDGAVQITTYLKSIIYEKKHTDMFFVKDNNLMVKRGKYSDQLSIRNEPLVSIRFSTIKLK